MATLRAPRGVAMGVVVALFAALLSFIAVVATAAPAKAASTPVPSSIHFDNTFFAYVKAGETLSVEIIPNPVTGGNGNAVSVTSPTGESLGGNGTYTASNDGIYTIRQTSINDYARGSLWDITVNDGAEEKTGRLWVERYLMGQSQAITEFPLWMVNNSGYVYSVVLSGYNGINSTITADSVGNAISNEDCATPAYASREYENTYAGCGEQYRLFFEEPSADLPESASSAAGNVPVKPALLEAEDLVVDDLAFEPANANASTAGTLSWTPPARYSGAYTLDIDVNGNGTYDDAVDRSVRMGADGSGTAQSFEFDGLDAEGNAIDTCVPVNVRVHFDRVGEIHLLQNDVEQRNGLAMTRTNGAGSPDSTMYWNDTELTEGRVTDTPVVDGRAGTDSSAGVHSWDYNNNSWGNERWIDDWTYLPIDQTAAGLDVAGSCLDIEKTSDMTVDSRPGDTITFEVTATNNGELPYTEDTPAVVTDDLSAVLDDAEYDDNAAASASDGSTTSDPSYAEPLIGWSGPLAVGESVTISYSVTLTGGGDGTVRNVAFAGDGETPVCDPPTEDGTDPDTGIPCAEIDKPMPKLSIAKVADRTDLPGIGETVTYTVTIANEGPGDYTDAAPATFTDDFTDVLDDAAFDESTIDASAGEATYDEPTLSWSGALEAGAAVTVSYTFTYTGGGDNVLRNAACVPEDEAAQGAAACSTRTVPTGALTQSKAVNPESGSEVRAGQEVTYTLTFNSVGEAAVDVSTYDDLSDLLDDASLTGEPVVDGAGITAVVDGERIVIEGSISAGDTVTVTYTVVVNAYEEQGDHSLGNVLADPDGTACAEGACETENPVQHLSVEKTSDAQGEVNTGDTVTYEVTVTNDGESDFTEDAPATAHDDLAGVLDDAQWNDDASAESGALSYDEPTLTWTGSLAAGASVTITYTVTITNQGDHELANVASLPDDLCDDADAPCESTVTTPLPHVTPAKSSDPATGEDVAAGQDVTYTLSFTNDGQAAGPVDSTDDLSGVLDDAELTGDPVSSSSAVQAILDGDALRVTGSIEPGETVTVTYVVTIGPDGERGDNVADNVLTPDTPPYVCAEDDPECDPFVPPTTSHNMGELDDWKTVDPASGSTVRPGQAVTYTLHFENTGTADIDVARDDVLTQVLDDAQVSTAPTASDESLTVSDIEDGRFTVAGTLEAGQLVTVTYTVTVNADGERGDDRLGNFLVDEGAEPPATCEPADGERADCTVNHVSNVVVTKSADPASGAQVGEGQEVTYTITFVNVSTNADAEAVAVDYTDHMSDVLDDATLTGNPAASSDDVSTTVSADTIVMAGAVATGETIRVTYTVTVKDYDEQGNHVLGNVIAVTGEEPVCAPDSPLCTSHETTKPAPSALPWTGVDGAVPALIAALLLLISGGTALIMVRRRREAGDIE